MHEHGLVLDLVRKAEALSDQIGEPVSSLVITVGALSGIDPDHVARHYELILKPDSPLAGAELEIELSDDPDDPGAATIRLNAIGFGGG